MIRQFTIFSFITFFQARFPVYCVSSIGHVLFLLLWVHFFLCWPEIISRGEEQDAQEGEEEVVESVATLVILKICFRQL